MNKKKLIAMTATAGVALSVLAFAGPAHAEPVSSSYVVVGSDTLQDVSNALANGTGISGGNVRSFAGGKAIGSFDATGSVLIQTKTAGPRFGRPNGSSDGVKALSRSIDGAGYKAGTVGSPTVVITGQVDIARSSSGAGTTANATGPLVYVPFGRDALTYAHSGPIGFNVIDQATLTGIFNCSITQVAGVDVVPVIPQAGSGTRADWLSKLGLTAIYATANPACVVVGQEHDTAMLADGVTPFPANGITAMSAAQWVAQATGAGIDRRGTTAVIGTPISGTPAVTGTGTATVPNAPYYANSTWGRDTYMVAEYARVEVGNPKYEAALAGLLDPTNSTSLTNAGTFSSTAGAAKKKFGFLPPSSTTPVRANLR